MLQSIGEPARRGNWLRGASENPQEHPPPADPARHHAKPPPDKSAHRRPALDPDICPPTVRTPRPLPADAWRPARATPADTPAGAPHPPGGWRAAGSLT